MTTQATILNQLGGMNKLAAMTGAYNFLTVERGVSFRLKSSASNYIKIVANGQDLYDVTIGQIRGANYKKVAETSGVFAQNLKQHIEWITGTRLSLS